VSDSRQAAGDTIGEAESCGVILLAEVKMDGGMGGWE
jgi:hypothetical protein